MSATSEARCASCRRLITPTVSALGRSCPKCGGLITSPKATTPTSRPAPLGEVQLGPAMAAAANAALAEAAEHATSVRHLAQLRKLAGLHVTAAHNLDAQRAREMAERRRRGRVWREFAAATAGDQ